MSDQMYDDGRSGPPADPPASLLRPETRRAALLSYLGPVVILFAVVGVALVYWVNRGPVRAPAAERSVLGTAGSDTPGGGDPRPRSSSTADEIRDRGSDLAALTSVEAVRRADAPARRVSLSAVEVERVDGTTMWVHDGNARLAVMLPPAAAAPARGARVDVSGVTETRDGSISVRADAVRAK